MEHGRWALLLFSVILFLHTDFVKAQRPGAVDLEVRLVGGPNRGEGVLEVRRNNSDWGTVCDDHFDSRDIKVVCRQLNLGDAGMHMASSLYRTNATTMFLDDMACSGSETNLGHCGHRGWGIHGCGPGEAVAIYCGSTDLEVRLVGGPNRGEGVLEVRWNNSDWGTVCDDYFDSSDIRVVCRQLNLGDAGMHMASSLYRTNATTMFLDDMACSGSETNLGHCGHRGWGIHGCGPGEAVAIYCGSTDLEVRLVGGPNRGEGVLEVRLNNSDWRTVCGGDFDSSDIRVVCRQLNLGDAGMKMVSSLYRTNATTMFLDDMACSGSETNLGHCGHWGWGRHNCGPGEAVAIYCGSLDLEVRLVGGPNRGEGVLEVRWNNSDWGTVCNDYFDSSDIRVVCRQLNLGDAGMKMASSLYRTNATTMFLDDMACSGSETNLGHCGHPGWGRHNCGPGDAVAIYCGSPEIRLVGPNPYEGRVEVRRVSREPWGSLCYSTSFGKEETAVVCRQLNLGHGKVIASEKAGNRTMYMAHLRCDGTESSLASCYQHSWQARRCDSNSVAAVHCQPLNCSGADNSWEYCRPSQSEDLEVRLVGGPNRGEGVLEVRRKNSDWGTVCDDHFDSIEIKVMCRQLNLGDAGMKTVSSLYRTNATTMFLRGMDCSGSETNLGHCGHWGWGIHNCRPQQAMAIYCGSTDLEVRLVGGPNRGKGVLEVRRNNSDWGTVCDDHFDSIEIKVVCRQLNLGDAGMQMASSQYRTNATTMFLDDMACSGSETNLGHCGHRGWGIHNCGPGEAVAILCHSPAATTHPLPESHKTRILKKVTKSEVGRKQLAHFKEVLQQQGQMLAADVVQAAMIVDRASQLSNISTQVATHMLKIVDTVAELNQSVLQESNSVGNTTNRLIVAAEQLADRVSLEEGQVRLQTNSTVLHVWNLASVSPSPFLGLQLRSDGDSQDVTSVTNLSDSDTYTNMDTAIFLPGDLGRNIAEQNPGRDIRLSASVTRQTGLFQVDSNTDSQYTDSRDTDRSQVPTTGEGARGGVSLDSKVAFLRISVDGQPVSNLSAFGQGNVTIVFTPLQPVAEKAAAAAVEQGEPGEGWQCVFWDFALRQGRGGWSGRGCYLEAIVEDKVKCVCDHLANFAILMDLGGQGEEVDIVHERVLGLVSMVGLILSISGLSLTLLALLLVRQLQKSLPHQTLFNMVLSMLLSWLTFLVGIERVESPVACVAVAMLLHYFILVSFLWMLARGILQFFMLVKARPRPFTRYMLKAGLLAWGLPALPVIVVSAVDLELYHGGQTYCWMSQTPFYYAFLAPFALIAAINVVIYMLVVVTLCCLPSRGTEGPGYTTIGIRASVSCFVVLGLSWIFAFFALREARLVFLYLFTCTTTLQGLLIFVLYTARDPAVRAFLRRVRTRWSPPADDAERPPNIQLEMRAIANID